MLAFLSLIFLSLLWLGTGTTGLAIQKEPAITAGTSHIKALPGFRVERIYSVPDAQGSWVSLAIDNKGRLITSDQYGGLYRVTPPPIGKGKGKTKVEKLKTTLGSAWLALCQ